MLFDDWQGLWRTLFVGVLAYTSLVVVLRASGKRTLTKLNAFDLVVTVALGSTLATILLSADVALAEGVLAMAVLVGMQFAITWTSVRWTRFRDWVASEPSLLVHDGRLLHDAMRRERVSEAEVMQVLRNEGLEDASAAVSVVLESDGSFSVIKRR